MDMSWTRLWDDSGDDDEDYDPLKDPLTKERDDSDDDFDGLIALLSPKKSRSTEGQDKLTEGDGNNEGPGAGGTVQESPEVIGKRTRRRVHLPDEVWQDAESQLEQAENLLDPNSPNEAVTDPNTQALSSQEYQRLLAVARGQAEPEEGDEDEEDEDFLPGSDAEGEGPRAEEEAGGPQVSISRGELSDLMAENRTGGNASDKAPKQRRGGRKKKHRGEAEVKMVSDGFPGGPGQGGFTKDQCIQLQGQMREYFQLASQQYVMSCCDKRRVHENTEDIKVLYEGLADLYRVWEVTSEYSKIQEKAMKILTDQIVGAPLGEGEAVQVRPEPRFSFFNVPGIEHVPTLLQRVSDVCSSDAQQQACNADTELRPGPEEGNAKALCRAQQVLDVVDPYFNPELKLSALMAGPPAGDIPGGNFTCAEDNLLLTGLRRFGIDWDKIRAHVLPTKTSIQLRTRYRRLVRRDTSDNPVKEWKLAHAAGLSEREKDLLHKGVEYYGARFDLICEKVIVNRTEEELRRAYAKLSSARALSFPSVHAPVAARTESKDKAERRRNKRSTATVHRQFLEDGSSSSDGGRASAKRRKGRGEKPCKDVDADRDTFEQENLPSSDEEDVGDVGAAAVNAQAQDQATMSADNALPRGVSAMPNAQGGVSGLVMTGGSLMSDSDSLPVFEPSNDGVESRQMFRLFEEGVSETSNDAWLVSAAAQPQPAPATKSGPTEGLVNTAGTAEAPGGSTTAKSSAQPPSQTRAETADAAMHILTTTVSTAAEEPGPTARSQSDVAMEPAAAVTGHAAVETARPKTPDTAEDTVPHTTPETSEETAQKGDAGSSEDNWSQKQDLLILLAGKAAAEPSSQTPTSYEEAWKTLNREGDEGLKGRPVAELARRYELLVSKALNFSQSTATSAESKLAGHL